MSKIHILSTKILSPIQKQELINANFEVIGGRFYCHQKTKF